MFDHLRVVLCRAGSAAGVVAALATTGCGGPAKDPRFWDVGEGIQVCQGSHTLPGIDVSEFQGRIDWGAVRRDGKVFAIARASYGASYLDHTFAENWHGIRTVGLVRGVYQYFVPRESGLAQADRLLAELAHHGGLRAEDLPPVMDIEETDGLPDRVIRARMASWLHRVKAVTGRTPMIYTGPFMSSAIGAGWGRYPLWVANYGVSCPSLPSAWHAWKFWQAADDGRIPGISGRVDRDIFDGNREALQDFIEGSRITPVTSPTCAAGVPDVDPADEAEPEETTLPDTALEASSAEP